MWRPFLAPIPSVPGIPAQNNRQFPSRFRGDENTNSPSSQSALMALPGDVAFDDAADERFSMAVWMAHFSGRISNHLAEDSL